MRPVFSYLCLALGLCALVFFALQCRVLYQLHFVFQETNGKVVDASVEERYHEGGGMAGDLPVSGGYAYTPRVIYEYEVSGHRYRGNRFNLNESTRSKKWAEEIINRYPMGATVPIFFNPEQPERSVLTKWLSWQYYVMVIFGSLLVGVGCVSGSIYALKKKK